MESTKNVEKKFSFGDYVLWFPKGNKSHLGKVYLEMVWIVQSIICVTK
jgi:hypothetical protein